MSDRKKQKLLRRQQVVDTLSNWTEKEILLQGQKNFARVLCLVLSGFLAIAMGAMTYFAARRQPIVKVFPDGRTELARYEPYRPGKKQAELVISHLNDGYLGFSYDSWEMAFVAKKPYIAKEVWEDNYNERMLSADEYRRMKLQALFYPEETVFLTDEAPFVVEVAGKLVTIRELDGKTDKREKWRVYTLTFEETRVNKENTLGLILTNRKQKDMEIEKGQSS